MTITWTISTLDRETATGFVTTAHWQATAVDGDYTATIYSTSSWPSGTPEVAYEDLTEATVLGWVWANGVDKEATEAALAANIAAQKAPVTATGTPWALAE
jgi:hypothetical protein